MVILTLNLCKLRVRLYTLHDCETEQIDVCCMCVPWLMDVVRHLSDGRMFNVKMREIDSGGCPSNPPVAQKRSVI